MAPRGEGRVDLRDYFIRYNSADETHTEAINAAPRDAGSDTYFARTDYQPGTNVPIDPRGSRMPLIEENATRDG